jgi:hypothetical protein
MYVYIFPIPAFLAFYAFVEQTLFAKACVCALMSTMSFATVMMNRDIVFSAPSESGPGVNITNQMLATYFVCDSVYHVWKFRWAFRRDLIFHHILILIPFLVFPPAIGMTFPIVAEVYSTGALFGLSPRRNLQFRAWTILTVRLFVWTMLFRVSFVEGQTVAAAAMQRTCSVCMLGLDLHWLRQIRAKLSSSA